MLRPLSQTDLQTQPQSEPSPTRRTALAVRIVTAGIALGLVLRAVIGTPGVDRSAGIWVVGADGLEPPTFAL